MRWARFAHDGRTAFGIVENERVVEVSGGLFDPPAPTGRTFALDGVRLLPPVVPPTFYATGTNYRQHLQNAASRGEKVEWPTRAEVNYRASNALIGDGDAIVIPADSSGRVAFEGELVVVIGKRAKRLSRENALDCVFGYTIGNDVSERSWQKSDRSFWRSKNCDTFKPMGPWIETDVDLAPMETRIRLNGREVSRFRTGDMLFGVADYLCEMSRYLTLHPGDVLWMGTEDPSLEMVPGDTVEVAITGIGALANPVIAGT
jgi:2-keto-4-pentenoate hydratase/2-oxohepta-3-ene-1,7-dioic acid hydratase in catechol pathway